MPVSNMIQFLAPHRLVKVDEDVVTAQAFHVFVHERVTGGAVVNKDGVRLIHQLRRTTALQDLKTA